MSGKKIGIILGKAMVLEGTLMIAPLAVSMICQESEMHILAYFIPAALLIIAGVFLQQIRPTNIHFYEKDGFVRLLSAWIVMVLFGAIPLVLNGDVPNYIEACCEVMPGFALAGFGEIGDIGLVSRSTLFWRSFSHWIGGIGILVFVFVKRGHGLLSCASVTSVSDDDDWKSVSIVTVGEDMGDVS